MAKFIYNSEDEYNREAQIIEFTMDNDLDIFEYKRVCERMASAMGYHENSIRRAFGEYEENRESFDFLEDIFGVTETQISGSLV